eukprot:TRINITY_DN5376_c0_g1_i2.p1 TRINITY_DN5376_c0_g1~~TRINITY_DN5376_c0_g1_i2.p1  ORF type:complete len:1547 (+),score=636.99 TRINITY_DN5376_c0_g1_i2:113-4753(+)
MTEKSERPKGTFQVGDKVWVRTAESDEQYFASARLREIAADGSCNVFDEVTYKQWKVPASDVWPVNPPSMDGVEDNTSMMFLYDPNLLHNLRFRYEKDLIYTYTAYILIAINPYKRLPLYGDEIIKNYSGKSIGMLPPHVYAIGDRAYRNMKGFRRNQSIVVSGESGAGKTETCKIVMRFFAVIAATNQGEQSQDAEKDLGRLESKILEANPVLESFGNAKTLRNNNSSRFGKFTKLHFDPHAKLSGASIVTYLLEKSRVVQQAKGERNFHIFYQILSGSSSDEKKRWRLADGSASQFEYLKKSGCTSVDGVDDAHEFHQIRKFMKALGITEEEQEELFAALSGLLHLGNISFTPIPLKDGHKRSEDASTVDDKVHVSDVTMSNVESASQLLGVEVELLKNMLVTRTITVGTPGNAKMAKENTYTIQFTETEAVHARDALSKHIYSVFFDWIVSRINLNIDLNNLTQFIGILDISGFEIFEVNSFEQMCINFANEKIQQYFNVQILQQEQEIYLLEGLKWRKVEYQDNQEVINLVEGKRTGIFALLDEECIMPKGTDKSFTSKVHTNHTSNNNLAVPVAKGKMRLTKDEGFVIKHFAGEVTYTSKNFLDKNNDTLHNDLQTLLMSTKKIMLRSIFKPTADEDERADDRSSNKRFRSVSGRFQGQLTLLINELNSTTSHFIRCIKPNEVQKPQIFNNHSVMTQLRYNGMCTALELMQVGFPTRIAFDELYVRYSPFLPLAFANLKPIIFCEALLVALDLHGGKDFQMGLTKVFFKAGKLKFLDELTSTSKDDIDKVVGKVRKWLAAKRWRGAIFAVKSLNRLQKQVEGIRRVKKWRRLGRFMLRIVRIWKPLLQKCRKKLLTSEAYQKKVQEEAQRREEERIAEIKRVEEEERLRRERKESKIRAREKEKKILEEKIVETQTQTVVLTNQIQEISQKSVEISAELSSEKRKNERLELEISRANENTEMVKTEMARTVAESTQLENYLKNEVEQLKAQLSEEKDKNSKLNSEKSSLEQEHVTATHKIKFLEEDVVNHKKTISEKNLQVENLTLTLSSQLSQERDSREREREMSNETIGQINQILTDQRSSISSLQERLNYAEEKGTRTERELEDVAMQKNQTVSQLQQEQSKNKDISTENQSLQGNIRDLKENLQQSIIQTQKLQMQFQNDIFNLKSNLLEEKDKLNQLQDEKSRVDKDLASALQKIKSLEDEILQLKQQIIERDGSITNLEASLSLMKETYANEMKKDLAGLLAKEKSSHEETKKNSQETVQQLNSTINQKVQQISQLEKDLEKMGREKSALKEEIISWEEKLSESEKKFHSLTAQFEILGKERQNLVKKLESYEKERRDLVDTALKAEGDQRMLKAILERYDNKLDAFLKIVYGDISAPTIIKDATKHGFITKQGKTKSKWQKRLLVLNGNFLLYYATANDKEPKGIVRIDEDRISTSRVDVSKDYKDPKDKELYKFCFKLIKTDGSHRPFHFCTLTEDDLMDWIKVLVLTQGWPKDEVVGFMETMTAVSKPTASVQLSHRCKSAFFGEPETEPKK